MKKNMIFLLLTFFMSGEVFSQSSRSSNKKKERTVQVEKQPTQENTQTKEDKFTRARIDTKDGAMYLGEFIEESDDAYMIKIISDDTLSIEKTDIRKARTPENSIVLNRGKYHSTTGLYLHSSFGLNGGIDGSGFMIDAGLGYRISKNLEILGGLGYFGTSIQAFGSNDSWGEFKSFFPGYLGVKYNLTHTNIRIYGAAKAGYANTPIESINEFIGERTLMNMSGGLYLEPSIGFSFASKRIGQSSISFTQTIQRSSFTLNSVDQHNNLVTGTGKIWIKRVGIKLTSTIF